MNNIDSAIPPVARYNEPQGPLDLGSVQVPTKEPWNAFIYSTRFWIMVVGVLSVYLEAKGFSWWGEAERNLVASLAAIFVTVRTIDRLGEKMG